jgi:hypothetical protein
MQGEAFKTATLEGEFVHPHTYFEACKEGQVNYNSSSQFF